MGSRLKSSKPYLGELCRIIKNAFDLEACLRSIIVLIPKKKVIDRLEGQTKGICVQSVLAKWLGKRDLLTLPSKHALTASFVGPSIIVKEFQLPPFSLASFVRRSAFSFHLCEYVEINPDGQPLIVCLFCPTDSASFARLL